MDDNHVKADHITFTDESIEKLTSSRKFIDGVHAVVPVEMMNNLMTEVSALKGEVTALKNKLGDDE